MAMPVCFMLDGVILWIMEHFGNIWYLLRCYSCLLHVHAWISYGPSEGMNVFRLTWDCPSASLLQTEVFTPGPLMQGHCHDKEPYPTSKDLPLTCLSLILLNTQLLASREGCPPPLHLGNPFQHKLFCVSKLFVVKMVPGVCPAKVDGWSNP